MMTIERGAVEVVEAQSIPGIDVVIWQWREVPGTYRWMTLKTPAMAESVDAPMVGTFYATSPVEG